MLHKRLNLNFRSLAQGHKLVKHDVEFLISLYGCNIPVFLILVLEKDSAWHAALCLTNTFSAFHYDL